MGSAGGGRGPWAESGSQGWLWPRDLDFLSFLGGCGKRLVNGESPGRSPGENFPCLCLPTASQEQSQAGRRLFVRAARLCPWEGSEQQETPLPRPALRVVAVGEGEVGGSDAESWSAGSVAPRLWLCELRAGRQELAELVFPGWREGADRRAEPFLLREGSGRHR